MQDACKFLKLTKPSIYKLIDTGTLRSVKILRTVRIPWESLKEIAGVG